jgi:hypothetical protein
MRELNIDELNRLRFALDDIIGYLSDNSCSDPECCGGPFYERAEFTGGVRELNKYGITVNERTVLSSIA